MSKAAAQPRFSRQTILYATIAVIIVGAIVAVAFASRVPQSATAVNKKAQLTVGQTAPAFNVSTTNGPFDLSSVQTPVVLEVFATWCPHCQHEVPVMNFLQKTYGGKVAIVAVTGSPYGIDGSSPENQADVLNFVQKLGVTYPVAYDADLKVANDYLQGGYPTIVIIDKSKKIRYLNDGEITPADLSKAIDGVLASTS
jgi:cytochrome c biogenesis protein CcmG/thiol:disulfide interchange protein DsbE